jgi:hypothetical protein
VKGQSLVRKCHGTVAEDGNGSLYLGAILRPRVRFLTGTVPVEGLSLVIGWRTSSPSGYSFG